jgi:pimeloyl-ACP methyl ester carboxylesterase
MATLAKEGFLPEVELARHLPRTRHGHVHVKSSLPVAGAPPLVLLHMSPLSSRMFDRVVPHLASRRQVVVPDRLGFGCSDRLQSPLPFEEYALATLDALDAVGVGEFDVCGIHTGSCEAIELAVTRPDRVRRVAIVAIPVFSDEELADFKATYFEPPAPAEDGSHLRWAWDWWRAWQQQVPGWDVQTLHDRVMDHVASWPSFWWTYHAVFDYPTAERVAQVRQPLLVLAPHDDLWPQTQHGRSFLPAQAEFVDLPHLSLEIFSLAAGEIAGHLERFLG